MRILTPYSLSKYKTYIKNKKNESIYDYRSLSIHYILIVLDLSSFMVQLSTRGQQLRIDD